MNNYRIAIWNKTTKDKGELLTLMEMQRPRFTKREYGMVIQEMFTWAAESIDYNHLAAEIYCNDRKVMTIDCKTESNTWSGASDIISWFSKDGKIIRRMCVAA